MSKDNPQRRRQKQPQGEVEIFLCPMESSSLERGGALNAGDLNCVDEILTGDALSLLKGFPQDWAQAVIADPPYCNVLPEKWDTQWESDDDYLDWSMKWVNQCMRILRPDGLLFCFGQLGKREHLFLHLMSHLCMHHRFHDLLIWDRAVGYNERRDSFTPAYEMILILKKSDKVRFNKDAVREAYPPEKIAEYARDKRYRDQDARLAHLMKGKYATNILRVPSLKGSSQEKCGHPTQKPMLLIDKLIACSTDEGDLVLDPFLGSGTTAVCAQKMRRHWVGIEKNSDYIKIAHERLKGREYGNEGTNSAWLPLV